MAIQKSIGKLEFWPQVELQPLKIPFWTLAYVITPGISPHMQILGVDRLGRGFLTYVKYNTFVTFLIVLIFSQSTDHIRTVYYVHGKWDDEINFYCFKCVI